MLGLVGRAGVIKSRQGRARRRNSDGKRKKITGRAEGLSNLLFFSRAPSPLLPRGHPPPIPPTEEPAAAAAAAAPAKAEQFVSFYADQASLANGVLTFIKPSKNLTTSVGTADMATAFAPGRFAPDLIADGAITGTTEAGKKVSTVLRFSEPAFADGVLTVKVVPFTAGMAPTLAGGYVTKALADPAFTPMSAELKTATLTKVDVIVDSKAAPVKAAAEAKDAAAPMDAMAAPMPATPAAGRRLRYDGNVITGAAIGSAACGGSWTCAAVGGAVAMDRQYDHRNHW